MHLNKSKADAWMPKARYEAVVEQIKSWREEKKKKVCLIVLKSAKNCIGRNRSGGALSQFRK
jgi:hypothetical protein